MRVDQRKIVKIDELTELVPREAGATWSSLWLMFYYTRLFKYIHKKHYPKIKKNFNKICTHKKLQKLCELGYFTNPQEDVYCAKDKVLPILKEAGFLTELLPSEPKGKGDINELSNTEVFISLIKNPHFFMLLYPHFDYLIPDALLVLRDQENRKYKLTFIEVERKKPEWEDYISKKMESYEKLAVDIEFYLKWKDYCEYLGFPKPEIKKTKFSYTIIKK